MKLALHRSITFWSGLLVMVFIGWAWRDSMSIGSFLNFPKLFFYSSQGGLTVAYHENIVPNKKIGREPPIIPVTEKAWMPSPYAARGEGKRGVKSKEWKKQHPGVPEWHATQRMQMVFSPVSSWLVFIPHWLILLSVALPWLGMLVWRARRRRRKTG